MRLATVVVLLSLGLSWQASQAQQPAWERPLLFTPSTLSVLGCVQQLSNGDFLVSGVKSNNAYSLIYARAQPGGQIVYQRTGRTLSTLEQDVAPLVKGRSLLAASVPGRRPSGNGTSRLFFQRLTASGDTLPGVSYPVSFLEGYPKRALREGDSVRVLAYDLDAQGLGRYGLLTVDTAGAVGQVQRYPNPVAFGNAYPCDLVRTPRGGWLIAGELAAVPYIHPYLVETDAQGRLRRQRVLDLFASSGDERVRRVVNNLLRLRDGSGYVFGGWHKTQGQTWGFLCKLDTALNVVWTYRHPPQATPALDPTRVVEQPDGTLGWLLGDEGQGSCWASAR